MRPVYMLVMALFGAYMIEEALEWDTSEEEEEEDEGCEGNWDVGRATSPGRMRQGREKI